MFKTIKLFFLFLFLVLSSFFFFSFSSASFSFTNIVSSISIEQNDDGRLKKYSDDTKNQMSRQFVHYLMYGVQQIKVVEGKREYTYQVDLLANAITQLMLKQDEILNIVDLDKLKDLPRLQLLNLLDAQGNLKHNHKMTDDLEKQVQNGLGDKYLNSLRSLFLKVKTLGIQKVLHPSFSGFTLDLSHLNKISVTDLKKITYKQLRNKHFHDGVLSNFFVSEFSDFTLFGLEAKTALIFSINRIWSPYLNRLKILTIFQDFFIKYTCSVKSINNEKKNTDLLMEINGEKFDISLLVNSSKTVPSNLSLEELRILKKLEKVDIVDLKTWITSKLYNYLKIIQPDFQTLADANIEIKIAGVTYHPNILLKAASTFEQFTEFLQDTLLEIFRFTIKDNLNILQDEGIAQVIINGKTYVLTELIKPVNKNKNVFFLSTTAKTELKVLAQDGVTKTQLDTALTEILTVRETEATILKTEKNQKKLIINLSIVGGALTLSALGGLFYWFFKAPK